MEEKLRYKLQIDPVEDFRIDFEDGYGIRSNEEEDHHAKQAASVVATGDELPQRIGIRIRALSGATEERAKRTLHLFLEELGQHIPAGFVVTLPKITSAHEVSQLAELLRPYPGIGIEIMIETPQAMREIQQLVYACEGRCIGAHFGAYDYMASCGITSAGQTLRHPACDFARFTMQMQLADLGIPIADGVTNLLPSGETSTVHAAWKDHADCVHHALTCGIYQGWDIHPAQLVSRYAAVYSFFARNTIVTGQRLKNFLAQEQQATRIGSQFDDAATVEGLKNFFERAVQCGAITSAEAEQLTR